MSRTVACLLAALAIQCGLLALAYRPAPSSTQSSGIGNLAALSPAEINRITIGDTYDNEAILLNSGSRWLIPALHDLPADADRIESTLKGLAHSDNTWPVAQSSSAHRRLEVADGRHQRRVILESEGNVLATVYLGTSPGFGKVHARNAAQDAVFSIELNNFDIPAAASGWIDPQLLQVRVPLRIHADLYTLRFDGGRWLSDGDRVPDTTELNILLTTLKTITISGIAGDEQSQGLAQLEADTIMEVESLAGSATLALFSREGRYFIQSSEYPLFFEIGESDFQRLTEVDIDLISGAATQ